ncbi:MAG: hypothetical protein JRI22_19390 [Deltaproteobacteria bacterium]|nr:hypothetical protein [Deltaproteobacteria bacterium]
MSFKRGLSKDFVVALNAAGDWWKAILADPELFVGIRDEYLNVYYKGNSILLLKFNNGVLSGRTHYKYLLNSSFQNTIPMHADGTYDIDGNEFGNKYSISRFDCDLLKKSCQYYAGVEKSGIQEILKANPNIIDVEIAFSQDTSPESELDIPIDFDPSTEQKKKGSPRIDFVALQKIKDSWVLKFFEAKHFSNKELRAKEERNIPVTKQIRRYEGQLSNPKNVSGLQDSYMKVMENILNLEGFPEPKKRIAREVIKNGQKIIVDPKPCLVVFGFDKDHNAKNSVWKAHVKRIENSLSKKRVLTKGDPKDFKTGISK